MNRLVLDLNSLMFDPARGTDRVAAALLVVAGVAGLSRSAEGFFTCVASALLLLSRRAARNAD
jgi:hypothetical protein